MRNTDVDRKVREAVVAARGDGPRAVSLLMKAAQQDPQLMYAFTAPFLQGIIFHAVTDVHGNVLVPEDRVRHALESGAGDPASIVAQLELALGRAWDDELEPFRHAGDGAPVKWLHRVG